MEGTDREEQNAFEIGDAAAWEKHLEDHGYVVLKNCASAEEVERARAGFWQCIERTNPGVKRDDPPTWETWRGVDARGIMLDGDLVHCEGAWLIRGLPKVQEAFARIWGDSDLISSFDSTLLWRPWGAKKAWRPRVEGLHIDQNPYNKPGRCCVQGMLPLYNVTEETGGLGVVPDSHKDEALKGRHRFWNGANDFCVVFGSDPCHKRKKLVLANAGDLILWDSRTVHGGLVGTQGDSTTLVRLTQTVCMVPRKWADEDVLKWRKEAFEEGRGTTHWPQETNQSCSARQGYVPITLTDSQKAVV